MVVLFVVGLIHLYLWKRLVRDPLRPGVGRRVGTTVVLLLAALVPLTLIGVRNGYFKWLSWPGYLWIAVMFYLLVTLAVMEIPRLLVDRLWVRDRKPAGKAAETKGADTTATAGTTASATTTAGTATSGTAAGGTTASETTSGEAAARETATGETATSRTATSGVPAAKDDGVSASAIATIEDTTGGTDEPDKGLERRLLLSRGAAIFAGLTAAGITGYGVKTATGMPQIDRFQMPMAKLPRSMDGTRLAVVSDIHIGPLTGVNHAQRIVQVINSVNADLVCVVGDLVDGSVAELGRFAAPLQDIQSRHGAFFVTGNHEYYSGAEEWIQEVDRLGIRPLRNERVAIEGLDLAGVNDLTGAQQGDAADYARALGDRDTARPVVLMAHQPVAARDAAPYGVDLQVSGHTHGGQMAPFNMLVKLQQPVVSGFGEVDGVPVYVTNGAGFWGPPVRVGAPPQVTVIELRVA
ncbi:putative MPP superfamily phosphohydrolase [Actinoplanes couchii]|nr:metallophosphoesterase [Actinoplanes couchii]MDR6324418.1 putative MPP superfamily phosphohydrolase [Actinoplanes couchii]